MIFWSVLVFVWCVGFAASIGAMTRIGLANPHTIYDSFSGDDTLDLMFAVLWPISWPCWCACKVAAR